MLLFLVASSYRNMTEAAEGRRGSFLVLGDWGWDPKVNGNVGSRCQRLIAEKMDQTMRELGDVKFIINVGDSFYPAGVRSRDDSQWNSKWRGVYSSQLRSVPWYSVYGNHDYYVDPCSCSSDDKACAQVNGDHANRDRFYMPAASWNLALPELDAEVVALDFNHFWSKETCVHSKCKGACPGILSGRFNRAVELFNRRVAESTARTLLIFSHYPTDYLGSHPDILAKLRDNTRHHIEYFGGHRHNVDQRSTRSISPNNNWLVGGGGGWSCDGQEQGFVVGELLPEGRVVTRAVLIKYDACCRRRERSTRCNATGTRSDEF